MAVFASVTIALLGLASARLNPDLSATPSMGWNSWNHYGLDISEQVVKDTADAFIRLGLDKLGFKYINIDDGWAHVNRSADGHVIVNKTKFPNGIKHVTDYVHSLGLKFGIYSDGGVYTCGGQAGSLGYEAIDAHDYAEWGVDYLKYDNCNNQGIPSIIRYTAMAQALNNTDRDIFFSLCNWGNENITQWAYTIGGNSWRISGDIWDSFDGVIRNLKWSVDEFNPNGYGPRIGWNDPDMLEVGNGGMSYDEYITHFSLWCLLKAPLLIGNDVTKMTKEDDAYWILSNTEALAVNQDPLGVEGKCVKGCSSYDGIQVWTAPLSGDGAYAIVVANLGTWDLWGDRVCWKDIGLGHDTFHVRDLWEHRNYGIHNECFGSFFGLKSHHSRFLKVTKANVGDCELHPEDSTAFRSTPCRTLEF